MPVPMWMGQVNKRVFNPMERRKGKRPVLIHVGRSSGSTYETPLDAHRTEDGYLFIMMYGPESDWVKNILDAGTARLRVDGEVVDLDRPAVVAGDAWDRLPEGTKRPPGFLNVTELLEMKLVA